MKFAVIAYQGKQFKVEEGQELTLDRVELEPDSKLVFDRVLLLGDDKNVEVGQPTIEKATVKATVLSHMKGERLRIATFKAKARVRKTLGFRHSHSLVKIDSINVK